MSRAPLDPPPRRTRRLALLLPAFFAPIAVLLAAAAGGRASLPILATGALYPSMAHLMLRGRRSAALTATLLWAASLSASVVVLTARDPGGAGEVILRGPEYRDEMFAFIRAGSGAESEPARFLPQHSFHLGAFVALAGASGGLLGVALGAVLISYMSYYVGALAAAGGSPALALLLGWPPWAILRVVAYALLGVALSRPVLCAVSRRVPRVLPGPERSSDNVTSIRVHDPWRTWYLAAFTLLVADALLKALLAPTWAVLLRPCLRAP